MRILGLDLGKKRIGVALSDETGSFASPLEVIQRSSAEADFKAVLDLALRHGCKTVVVGVPYNMDGSSGPAARSALSFMDELRRRDESLVVEGWDERLSTAAVERVLIDGGARRDKRKEVVDKLAASYILQGYLDSERARSQKA